MPFEKKEYRQIAREILSQIAGGTVSETLHFDQRSRIYKLRNAPITQIDAVTGSFKGAVKLFEKGTDYRLNTDAIEWLSQGVNPDDGTLFTVNYLSTSNSGITDLNAGSVVRTIVEAVSREIEYLYLEMEEVYLSGFLDTATGKALDFVVSILGIKRKPPQTSSGYVTFGRTSEPELQTITNEIHLFDGSTEYELKKLLAKEVTRIEGTMEGESRIFEKEADFLLAKNNIRWLTEGFKPDPKTVFKVDYTAFREITIPQGTSVATQSSKPEDVRMFNTVESKTLVSTREGKWEAEIQVICAAPGPRGNVLAGTIGVMPQAIPGVEYIINKADTTNGVDSEQDEELRERSKHALEFAGKATYSSVESAIKSVEGVRSLLIEDMPDKVPGIVKVIVDGGDLEKIREVVDDTRAAGIKVEISKPNIVHVDMMLTLVLEKSAVPAEVSSEVEKRIRAYISNLGIGDSVLYSRVVESIVGSDGIWDVRDLRLIAYRPEKMIESEQGNLEISHEERAEPKRINISFEMRK